MNNNENNSNSNMEKMFVEIVRSIFKTKPTLMGRPEIGQEWSGVSTSGNCYSDDNTVRGWTWSPENGLREIRQHKCSETASNANGTWEHAWGFDTSDVDLNEAILLVEEEHSYSDCNGRDDYEYSLTAYKLDGFKEAIQEAEKKSWAEFEAQVKEWLLQ